MEAPMCNKTFLDEVNISIITLITNHIKSYAQDRILIIYFGKIVFL